MRLMTKRTVYIPTKGRDKFMVTSKALTAMGVFHYIIVEPQEVSAYKRSVQSFNLRCEILPLDLKYKETYELCDSFGLSKSTGPGPARNFAWDHSIGMGARWHWVMDDNIKQFYRLNNNLKVPIRTESFWTAMEDFCARYSNAAMAGPNYFMFASRKAKMPPFVINTRIYSCNLIRNDVPFRWRGRYNEDTILSIDMLKAKWCTIQFNAFLQEKMETQKLPGGNTSEFYLKEGHKIDGKKYSDTGTIAKSRMLVKVHPDVSRIAYKFKRWHHHVDYSKFKKHKLILADKSATYGEPNEYGMRLVKVKGKQKGNAR